MAKPTQSVQKRQRERDKALRRQEKERRRAERQADRDAGVSNLAEGPDIRDYFRDPEDPGDSDGKP